eukprot:XP_001691160.1 predicted protein [Chlamydomonas reinhardtii]
MAVAMRSAAMPSLASRPRVSSRRSVVVRAEARWAYFILVVTSVFLDPHVTFLAS